jgi:hypothetical protein
MPYTGVASGRSLQAPLVHLATPGAIDALVQAALVELFDAYGVALDPTPCTAPVKFHEVAAAIGFTRAAADGDSCPDGWLTLSMPSSVFTLVKDDAACSSGRDDWAKELTNQLMGRIKNRLLQLGATVQIGLPVICSTSEHSPHTSTTSLTYMGATMGGDVLVTLEGMPEESELSGVAPEGVALEGDAIFF